MSNQKLESILLSSIQVIDQRPIRGKYKTSLHFIFLMMVESIFELSAHNIRKKNY